MSRGLNIAWLVFSVGMTVALCIAGKAWPAAMFGFMAGVRALMALEPRG